MQSEEWRQNLGSRNFCWSHLGGLLALCKAHQTIPDTLSGIELTALLTPLLLTMLATPRVPPYLIWIPSSCNLCPYSLILPSSEREQLVTILRIIILVIMKVVIESLFHNSSPGLTTQTYLLGNWQRWQVEQNTFKTYSHLVKCWIGKLL